MMLASPAWAQIVPPPVSAQMPADEGEAAPEEAVPVAKKPEAKPASVPEKPAAPLPFNAVRLRGLDKVTARISTIDAPMGLVTRFENLEIVPLRCWQAPPEDQPENAALLNIRELKEGVGPQDIFKGWMYASSPALSGLEHPVYDVTVIECEHLDKLE